MCDGKMCGNNCSKYGSGAVDIGVVVVVEDSTTTTSSSLNYTEHLQQGKHNLCIQ